MRIEENQQATTESLGNLHQLKIFLLPPQPPHEARSAHHHHLELSVFVARLIDALIRQLDVARFRVQTIRAEESLNSPLPRTFSTSTCSGIEYSFN